jgi:hypothetical protein
VTTIRTVSEHVWKDVSQGAARMVSKRCSRCGFVFEVSEGTSHTYCHKYRESDVSLVLVSAGAMFYDGSYASSGCEHIWDGPFVKLTPEKGGVDGSSATCSKCGALARDVFGIYVTSDIDGGGSNRTTRSSVAKVDSENSPQISEETLAPAMRLSHVAYALSLILVIGSLFAGRFDWATVLWLGAISLQLVDIEKRLQK